MGVPFCDQVAPNPGGLFGSCGAGLGIARAERRLGGWIRTAPGKCRDGPAVGFANNFCAPLVENFASFLFRCREPGTGPGTVVGRMTSSSPDLDDVMCARFGHRAWCHTVCVLVPAPQGMGRQRPIMGCLASEGSCTSPGRLQHPGSP